MPGNEDHVFKTTIIGGLTDWFTDTPPALVAQHLNVDQAMIAKWPGNSPGVMPNS